MSNLVETHQQRIEGATTLDSLAFLDNLIGEQPQQEGQPSQPAQPEQGEDDGVTAMGVAKDIGRGIIEIPTQVAGGVIDGLINDTSDLAYDVAGWLNSHVDLGTIQLTEDGFEIVSGMPEENILKAPTTPEAESTTGKMVRGITNFTALFIGAGKLRGIDAVNKAAKGGRISKAMMQGFVADFVDNPDSNLSDLIQQYPDLENPVTEYLAGDENTSELDQRFRNALEGLGLGVAADGFIASLKTLKQARKVKQSLIDEKVIPEHQLSDQTLERATDTSALGTADKPLLKTPENIDPEAVLKGADPEEADVFINWSRIDSDDDLKSIIQNMADASKGTIDEARRGVRSWQQTKLSANQKNAWDILQDMNTRGRGATLNAEEAFALRELWVRSGSKLKEAAQLAASDSSSNAQFQFQKMLTIHGAIQEKIIAARTETARALNSWKIPSGGKLENLMDFDDVINGHGGNEYSKEMAEKFLALGDNPAAQDTFVRGSALATSKEAVAQLWYFSLLSSPHTHMRNGISNVFTSIMNVAERKAASMIGDAVAPEEPLAILAGQVEGMKAAFKITSRGAKALGEAATTAGKGKFSDAGQILKENASEFGSVYRAAATGRTGYGTGGKLDMGHEGQFTKLAGQASQKLTTNMAENGLHKMAGIMDTSMRIPAGAIDAVTMIPGRSLQTADEFFKTINYHGELHAQAARKASEALRAGDITADQFNDFVADVLADPAEYMRIASRKQAEVLSFTEAIRPGSKIGNFIQATGNIPVAGRILMPFTRVVYNMGAYSFERTPFAPLVSRWRNDMAQGGAARDMALAKVTLGTSALLSAADMSMRGQITGGGSPDMGERVTERRMGIQPNSIKVGDRYYSYQGMEPIATPLKIASNITEIISYYEGEDNPQVDELTIAAAMSIGDAVINQEYMTGLSNFIDGVSDPTKSETWFKQTVASMAPAGLAQYNRSVVDPYMRQVENWSDAWKARIPGLSDEIPYKLDLWGRKIDLRSGLGEVYDVLSPVYSRKYDPEPIDLELRDLGYYPEGLGRSISFDGVDVDMESYPEAWERLKELSGNAMTKDIYGVPVDPITGKGLMDTLNMIVQGKHPGKPMYKYMTDGPDGGKAMEIRNVISTFRDKAKGVLLSEYPNLRAEVELKKSEQKRYTFQ